jgi:hypothetical protein
MLVAGGCSLVNNEKKTWIENLVGPPLSFTTSSEAGAGKHNEHRTPPVNQPRHRHTHRSATVRESPTKYPVSPLACT